MPKFVTIGYGDEDGYKRTSQATKTIAHKCDETLVLAGAVMGIAGKPIQVCNPELAGVETKEGAFMSARLPIAGFTIIEADSLEQAVELVSKTPCSVAHGVVEVWPLIEPDGS